MKIDEDRLCSISKKEKKKNKKQKHFLTSALTIFSIIVNNVSSNLQLWTPSNHSLRCSFASRNETSKLLYVFSAAKFWKNNNILYKRLSMYLSVCALQSLMQIWDLEKKNKVTYDNVKFWINVDQFSFRIDNW